jgi:hypothetical protein
MVILLTSTCIPVTTSKPVIEKHHGALFQTQGYLIGGLSWGHITVDMDLTSLTDDINQYQKLVDYFRTVTEPKPQSQGELSAEGLKRTFILHQMCERKVDKMRTILNELQADLKIPVDEKEHTKPKRQIAIGIAAIGGLIVGAVTGSLFSQFKTSALVDVLEKRVQTITSQIDQNTIMVLQSEADIKKLNQSLSIMEKLIGKIVLTQKTFDLTVYGLYTSLILEEQLKRMEQLETAIDHLLLGKFHKGLVSIDGILDALAKLKTNALNHGLLVGVQRPLELYQLPVSFLFNSTSRIIHV